MKQASVPASVDVPRETRDRLRAYADLLARWNERINLVSRADLPLLWSRHVEDSLQLADHLPAAAFSAVDLGSGAGFPGLVLAIATGIPFALIEADARKAAFLREAARVTAAPVRVHAQRIETTALDPVRLVTARALAPLPQLLAWAAPLLSPDGACLFPKGQAVEAELDAARRAGWRMDVERLPSRTAAGGVILRLSGVRRG